MSGFDTIDFQTARRNMVDNQIRCCKVLDTEVLELLSRPARADNPCVEHAGEAPVLNEALPAGELAGQLLACGRGANDTVGRALLQDRFTNLPVKPTSTY